MRVALRNCDRGYAPPPRNSRTNSGTTSPRTIEKFSSTFAPPHRVTDSRCPEQTSAGVKVKIARAVDHAAESTRERRSPIKPIRPINRSQHASASSRPPSPPSRRSSGFGTKDRRRLANPLKFDLHLLDHLQAKRPIQVIEHPSVAQPGQALWFSRRPCLAKRLVSSTNPCSNIASTRE